MKITKNYYLDISGLRKWNCNGFDLIDFSMSFYNMGDHSPRIFIFIVLFNYVLIDFSIYNINHKE